MIENKVALLSYFLFANIFCLIGQNIVDPKVDSLFQAHIISLNGSTSTISIKNNIIKQSDNDFLDMFYYLSGIKLGKEEHSYGRYPRFINKVDVRKLESWYNAHKGTITYERILRIYQLIEEYTNIRAKNLEDLEYRSNSIDIELDTLRIM